MRASRLSKYRRQRRAHVGKSGLVIRGGGRPSQYDTGRPSCRGEPGAPTQQSAHLRPRPAQSIAPPGIANSLARNASADRPLLLIIASIGNDVCNGHPGSDNWATVAEFQSDVLKTLKYLDTVLPAGSHVAFLPLVDGRVLYDTTHTLTHPLGVGYPDVYEYLSCSGVRAGWRGGGKGDLRARVTVAPFDCPSPFGQSRPLTTPSHRPSARIIVLWQGNPCWGWLNTNETWRNATSQRAADLSAVYDKVIAVNGTAFKSFDMYKFNIDWRALIAEYVSQGGVAANVIEVRRRCGGLGPAAGGRRSSAALAASTRSPLPPPPPPARPAPSPWTASTQARLGTTSCHTSSGRTFSRIARRGSAPSTRTTTTSCACSATRAGISRMHIEDSAVRRPVWCDVEVACSTRWLPVRGHGRNWHSRPFANMEPSPRLFAVAGLLLGMAVAQGVGVPQGVEFGCAPFCTCDVVGSGDGRGLCERVQHVREGARRRPRLATR